MLSLCFYVFFKNISVFFNDIKSKKAGLELQKKILFTFSIIALTPTIVIALFAVFIFDTTLNGWFNKKISTAIDQSVEVANKYLLEHQNAMRGDILELANVLNVNANILSSDKQKFNKYLNNYTLKHNLSEVVIIDSIGNVLASSGFVFEYTYTEISQNYYNKSNQGEIIIAKEDNSNKMRAFLKLSQYIDAYLLITRFVDEKVLNAIDSWIDWASVRGYPKPHAIRKYPSKTWKVPPFLELLYKIYNESIDSEKHHLAKVQNHRFTDFESDDKRDDDRQDDSSDKSTNAPSYVNPPANHTRFQ